MSSNERNPKSLCNITHNTSLYVLCLGYSGVALCHFSSYSSRKISKNGDGQRSRGTSMHLLGTRDQKQCTGKRSTLAKRVSVFMLELGQKWWWQPYLEVCCVEPNAARHTTSKLTARVQILFMLLTLFQTPNWQPLLHVTKPASPVCDKLHLPSSSPTTHSFTCWYIHSYTMIHGLTHTFCLHILNTSAQGALLICLFRVWQFPVLPNPREGERGSLVLFVFWYWEENTSWMSDRTQRCMWYATQNHQGLHFSWHVIWK